MERDFYTDEFEQLIKEKADQFRMYPSRRVWHSIYNNLHPSRRWPSFIISLFFFSSLYMVGYLNTGDDSVTRRAGVSRPASELNKDNLAKNVTAPLNPAVNASPTQGDATTASLTQAASAALATSIDKAPSPQVNSSISTSASPLAGFSKQEKPVLEKTIAANAYSNKPHKDRATKAYVSANNPRNLVASTDAQKLKPNASKSAEKQVHKNTIPNTAEGTITTETGITGDTDDSNNESSQGTSAGSNQAELTISSDTEKEKNLTEKIPATITAANNSKENDKSWIEHFAQYNKPAAKKWASRLEYEVYVTPAVNYRKLTTDSKGSTAPFATTGDINKAISQRPGLGIESGIGLSYAFAKNLRLKAGLQFNYTNYNINADQIGHPVQTTILMTDPVTGYSYPAARASSIANVYDQNALQPVTLHNRTYQVSLPVGLAYKLSSNKNVEWFVGASAQPSYIFGGKAHLISSDLKNYISDPSAIRVWNLNIGLETFMNYKLGSYSLRVGPQVRYQVYSTYRKDVALIEKPYAVGLKIGILKGF